MNRINFGDVFETNEGGLACLTRIWRVQMIDTKFTPGRKLGRNKMKLNPTKATGNEHLTGRCMMCGKESRGAFCSKECRNRYNAIVRMNR